MMEILFTECPVKYIDLLMGATGLVIFVFILFALIYQKPLSAVQYESQIDLLNEKISALVYDNEMLSKSSHSKFIELLRVKKDSKIKDAALKTLTETLNQTEDYWMAKAISKLENNGGMKISMEK